MNATRASKQPKLLEALTLLLKFDLILKEATHRLINSINTLV